MIGSLHNSRFVLLFFRSLVAPGLFGCKQDADELPRDKPLISAPRLVHFEGSTDNLAVDVVVCNRDKDRVTANVKIEGAPADIVHQGYGFSAGKGTYLSFGCGIIKLVRTKPIRVTVDWKQGAKSGRSTYEFSKDQDGVESIVNGVETKNSEPKVIASAM